MIHVLTTNSCKVYIKLTLKQVFTPLFMKKCLFF